jgi:hypothetical protein
MDWEAGRGAQKDSVKPCRPRSWIQPRFAVSIPLTPANARLFPQQKHAPERMIQTIRVVPTAPGTHTVCSIAQNSPNVYKFQRIFLLKSLLSFFLFSLPRRRGKSARFFPGRESRKSRGIPVFSGRRLVFPFFIWYNKK